MCKLAWLLIVAQGAPAEKDDRRMTVDIAARPTWAPAVAKLQWLTKQRKAGNGTAVLVAPKLAVTTYHCVRDWTGKAVLTFGYHRGKPPLALRRTKEIVASSASGDWAILRLTEAVRDITPLAMATKALRDFKSRQMLLAGYSCDRANGRRGAVLTYDAKAVWTKLRSADARILTNARCFYGASGGPAFLRDGAGQLHWVGLVQGNINVNDKKNMVTYAVYQTSYAKTLRAALARARKAPMK